jgi:putative AlgH/UPF0301 family transcriptional regulator
MAAKSGARVRAEQGWSPAFYGSVVWTLSHSTCTAMGVPVMQHPEEKVQAHVYVRLAARTVMHCALRL